jgi:hypothetical protein
MYKICKFQVQPKVTEVIEVFKSASEGFMKVAKKEDLAAKVLSADVLAKFKTLKSSLLSTVILCQNILGKVSLSEMASLVSLILQSKSIDMKLKMKVLIPGADFKKVNFNQYYQSLNENEIHNLIMKFIVESVIHDESQISHSWTVIDQGLTMIKGS